LCTTLEPKFVHYSCGLRPVMLLCILQAINYFDMNENEVEKTTNKSMSAMLKSNSSLVKDLAMPIAVVLAGAFIGLGFFFSGGQAGQPAKGVAGNDTLPTEQPITDTTDKIKPVTEVDHIKGNPNAPINIVEYSDFECPFCKQFHSTLESVQTKYGADKVAWVYRQFPLDGLHQKARPVALASECVAELGGNDAFWKFTDGYFDKTLTNDKTDIETLIPQLVTTAGVDKAAFNECFESERLMNLVDEDIQNAAETGGRGTPWSIVIGPNGETKAINGSLPQQAVEQIIDSLLAS
jgi:protein-disulfide isomerase